MNTATGTTDTLIGLAKDGSVNAISKFAEICKTITEADLIHLYQGAMASAPSRSAQGLKYFGPSRTGAPSTNRESTNRSEEHLAMCIYNDHCTLSSALTLPGDEYVRILDYQFPLFARRIDSVRKADLFGVLSSGHAVILELKDAKGKDTPLRALLEGLAYAAIVQANIETIRQEARLRFDLEILSLPPVVMVMAPVEYWQWFRTKRAAGNWQAPLIELAKRVQNAVNVSVLFVQINNCEFDFGLNGQKPKFRRPISCEFALK